MSPFMNAMTSVLRHDGPSLAAEWVTEKDPRTTPLHAHACGQLLGATVSLTTLTTADGRSVISPANAVWIPPNQLHAIQSHGAFSGWSVYVAERVCASLPDALCSLEISPLLRAAVARAASWSSEASSAAQLALADVILDEIRSLPRDAGTLPMPRDARLSRVAATLLENPGDSRTLTELAESAGVSERTVTRGFMAETGMAFSTWRRRARLLRAMELLASGAAVTSVALEVGYSNVGAFIDMFKKEVGVTPGQILHARPEGS